MKETEPKYLDDTHRATARVFGYTGSGAAMNPLIEQHKDALVELCQRFQVQRLELFGSACTPEFDSRRSDLDFLVEFTPGCDLGPWLSRFLALRDALAELFGCSVDLVMPSALNNSWFRREADKTRTLIYDASTVTQVA